MEFRVNQFPKKMGEVDVNEKFVKIKILEGGLFSSGEDLENIPIKNISNVKISKAKNICSIIFCPKIYFKVFIKELIQKIQMIISSKGNLAPKSASDQIQNYVLGGIIVGVIYNCQIIVL
ncbi:hypothetical protein CI088_09455 [Enterococcus plantarum]|uniref:YetF-like N-terminal transmembrane domain-containing protein n=1 Tax=Enterococcus plantarum TaxID=1077675 RepID=A0A2W3ZG98_9ENTE|nr:hypothetical protein [Enterococcus plantarum]PZL73084.1 hypothetical protein CI088_09455 [Enterococcus plantarum]